MMRSVKWPIFARIVVLSLHGPEHAEFIPVGKVRVSDIQERLYRKTTGHRNNSHGALPRDTRIA